MISLVVRVRAKPGEGETYARMSREFGKYVEANRDGCVMFRTYRTGDPLEFVTIEHFETEAALAAHQATDHTKQALANLQGVIEAPPQPEVLTQLA